MFKMCPNCKRFLLWGVWICKMLWQSTHINTKYAQCHKALSQRENYRAPSVLRPRYSVRRLVVYSLWVCSELLPQVKDFKDLWVLFRKEGQIDERKERMMWIQAVKTSFICRWLCWPMELEVESLLLCSRRGQESSNTVWRTTLLQDQGFRFLVSIRDFLVYLRKS